MIIQDAIQTPMFSINLIISVANFFAIVTLVWVASAKMTALEEARKSNADAISDLKLDIKEVRQDIKTLIKDSNE